VSGQVLAVNITCKGTEFRLEYCSTDDPGIGTCGYNEYVAVSCAVPSSSEFPRDGDIRLVDGPSSAEGRVQIYHNGLWGTVCDNRFSDSDAKVVCRQLEHPTSASKARGGAYYGPGIGPIWLDEVACYGSEARLSQCTHGGWRNTDCYHSTDAGVVCKSASDENATSIIAGVTASFVVIVIFVIVGVIIWYHRKIRSLRLSSMSETCSSASQTPVCQVRDGEMQPEASVRYSSLTHAVGIRVDKSSSWAPSVSSTQAQGVGGPRLTYSSPDAGDNNDNAVIGTRPPIFSREAVGSDLL
jgi:hypothetical protein